MIFREMLEQLGDKIDIVTVSTRITLMRLQH